MRNVSVELIIAYFECLHHPEETCAHNIHGGESEVWVAEKDIFGYTKLEASCFKYESIPEEEKAKAKSKIGSFQYDVVAEHKEGSLTFSQMLNKFVRRPCESNWVIERLIKKEKKKNEEILRGVDNINK